MWICSGFSKDINSKTLFLMTEGAHSIVPGESGIILVETKDGTKEFPCKVVRYASDGVVLEYHGEEARAFFHSFIVKDRMCYDCGGKTDLAQCPPCNGINTICLKCLTQKGMCRDCRSVNLLYKSKSIGTVGIKKSSAKKQILNITLRDHF